MASAAAVVLPGGMWRNGIRERRAVFNPPTGYFEQRLLEIEEAEATGPARVTMILAEALARVGPEPADAELAASLCVADRQFLMLRLLQRVEADQVWLRPVCRDCGSAFDVGFKRSMLPVKEAGPGYPRTKVVVDGHALLLRVPTGRDQEGVSGAEDEDAAIRRVLASCLASPEGGAVPGDLLAGLEEEDMAAIDGVLDEMSPAVCQSLAASCPECGEPQIVPLNPYGWSEQAHGNLYEQVHELAFHYHWSEKDILALPTERRLMYLEYIDRQRGLYS